MSENKSSAKKKNGIPRNFKHDFTIAYLSLPIGNEFCLPAIMGTKEFYNNFDDLEELIAMREQIVCEYWFK